MKMKASWIVIAVFLFIIVAMTINPSVHQRPRTNYFIVGWTAPEDVAYYKGYMSSDYEKITRKPFDCQKLRLPPPRKAGLNQSIRIQYQFLPFTYDLYVRIFAFDIDGNYYTLDLLNEEVNL